MVRTGLDVLMSDHLGELKGKRVGIVANHASVTSDLVHIADALYAAGVRISALFGPEHGVRGDVADGEPIADAKDERLGAPIFSLYGRTRVPTPETLENVDVMIVDLQDVGSRFYTFLYTMSDVMGACGKQGIPVWVMDRPNPITGLNADGAMLEPACASFVGLYAIPMRHGLTIGELAILFRDHFGVKCDLRVMAMKGWSRDMWFEQTGLPWVLPSPNMPTPDTASVFPGMCLIEGTNVSEGRGMVRPFETFGAPWVEPNKLREALMDYKLPGVMFREAYFSPLTSKCQGAHCRGLQLYVTDREAFKPPLTGVAVTAALRGLFPGDFEFRQPSSEGRRHFDLIAGNTSTREAIEAGKSPWEIAETWRDSLADFEKLAAGVRMY